MGVSKFKDNIGFKLQFNSQNKLDETLQTYNQTTKENHQQNPSRKISNDSNNLV